MISKLDKEQIKRFLVSHDSKKKQMGMEDKTTMVYINGKATYLVIIPIILKFDFNIGFSYDY